MSDLEERVKKLEKEVERLGHNADVIQQTLLEYWDNKTKAWEKFMKERESRNKKDIL